MPNKKYYLIIIILLYSCSIKDKNRDVKSNIDIIETNHEVYVDGKDYILLDENTSIFNHMSEPITYEGENKLLIYGHLDNSLMVYDMEEHSMDKKIVFPKEGPDALQLVPFSSVMKYVNSDTVVFFNTSWDMIFLADLEGEVYKRVRLSSDSVGFNSAPTNGSLEYKNKKVFIQSWPKTMYYEKEGLSYDNRPATIGEIDLETGEFIQHEIKYPSAYYENKLSQQLKYLQFIYNAELKSFVISFPFSDSLLVTDFNDINEKYLAKSTLVERVSPIDSDANIPKNDITSYYNWMSDAYTNLIYDANKGYYYRFARSRISEEQYKNREIEPNKEVLVLDEHFNAVATIKHNGGSLFYYYYDNENVYWNTDLVKFNRERENEDTIYFERYEVY